MTNPPSTNGSNGRDTSGRFVVGCKGGPGNPFARRTAQLRAALLDILTEDDLTAIVCKLIELAKGGDLAAIRELFDRTLGKAVAVTDDNPPDRFAHMIATVQRKPAVQLPAEFLLPPGMDSGA